jgi:RimJ/RimL family protein N-acetyltransferase
MTILFETERTIVREFKREDFDDFATIFTDFDVMRYVENNQPMTPLEARRYFDKTLSSYRQNGFGCWAVYAKADNGLIGCTGLEYLPDSWDVELIYILKKSNWGKGVASEISTATLRYAFDCCGLLELCATIDPNNKPSIRIAEKLGMEFVRSDVDEYRLPIVIYRIRRPSRGNTGLLMQDN